MAKAKQANELRLVRVFEAPVRTVWEAWNDLEQVAQWWGPRGFTLTHHSKDLRAGGHWSYTMHGPDGVDWPNKTLYLEVEPLKRLVYDHGGSDDRPPLFRVTALFRELPGDRTELDMTMAFASAQVAAETKVFIKKAGGDSTWDRLAEHLGERKGKDPFIINRSFTAPIATVYALWTDPKHLVRWLAPTGSSMTYIRADIREGGTSFYSMTDANGVTLWGRAHYLKMEPQNRLVYTQQFVDANENISRHPFAPTWPETMITEVRFTEEGPDETRVTVTWEVYAEANADERAMFHNAKAGMTQGWGGSFDKLDAVIAEGV